MFWRDSGMDTPRAGTVARSATARRRTGLVGQPEPGQQPGSIPIRTAGATTPIFPARRPTMHANGKPGFPGGEYRPRRIGFRTGKARPEL